MKKISKKNQKVFWWLWIIIVALLIISSNNTDSKRSESVRIFAEEPLTEETPSETPTEIPDESKIREVVTGIGDLVKKTLEDLENKKNYVALVALDLLLEPLMKNIEKQYPELSKEVRRLEVKLFLTPSERYVLLALKEARENLKEAHGQSDWIRLEFIENILERGGRMTQRNQDDITRLVSYVRRDMAQAGDELEKIAVEIRNAHVILTVVFPFPSLRLPRIREKMDDLKNQAENLEKSVESIREIDKLFGLLRRGSSKSLRP